MIRIVAVLLASVALLAAGPRSANVSTVTRVDRNAANWRILKPPLAGPYSDIIVGPARKIWISSTGANALAGLDTGGKWHRLSMNFDATSMTLGSDGRIYMTQQLPQTEIAAITTGGRLSLLYDVQSPNNDSFTYTELASGADGNFWFGEFDHLASVSPSGTLTEYPYANGEKENVGVSLFTTPSRLYYTVCCQSPTSGIGGYVGYLDFQSKFLTEYAMTSPACDTMSGLGIAGDGKLYVLCSSPEGTPALVRLDGVYNEKRYAFPYAGPIYSTIDSMVIGPDGNIWFTPGTGGVLVRFDIAAKAFDQYFTPDGSSPVALTVGPDNNIWTVAGNSVDVFLTKRSRSFRGR